MATRVLFIQGGGADTHDGWDYRLVASLQRGLGSDYEVHYPRMPNEDDPSYAAWQPTIARELDALPDGSILVGHSIGGTILLHVLAEHALRFRPRALALVATPFIGEGGWPSEELPARTSFGLPADLPVFFYQGTADDTVDAAHVDGYARAVPHATIRMLPDRDHQLNDDLAEVAQDLLRV